MVRKFLQDYRAGTNSERFVYGMKYPLRLIQVSQRVFTSWRGSVRDYLFQATATYSFVPLNLKFLILML